MHCPHCGGKTTFAGGRCTACGRPAPRASTVAAAGVLTPTPGAADLPHTALDAETMLGAAPGNAPFVLGSAPTPTDRVGPLAVGQAFGTRYQILRVLGQGGMGCVYQAWDAELGVAVALKVIRPEIGDVPGAEAALERRFKRELLLARQVTHKNVVRIHDLGEIDGIKYLTMSYVEGMDLNSLLQREGKLPVARALAIARGMASGLVAAHQAGVVHRDLKPANIMIDAADEPLIMDFGIARSASVAGKSATSLIRESEGAPTLDGLRQAALLADYTVAGTLVGTIQYMAPEQMRGAEVDQRADIYAFGLILYDLLAGRRRAEHTGGPVSELNARMIQAPEALRSFDAAVPAALDRVVTRCIEPDAANRYQTSVDLAADLDRLDAAGNLLPVLRRFTTRQLAAASALVVAALAATWWIASRPEPLVEHEPVSVLITDFVDRTNDPVFKETLEQALGLAVEEATFITNYSRAGAQRLAAQIRPGSKLDESVARLITMREGIKVILAGSIEGSARAGGYELTVNAIDSANGNRLATATASAAGKGDVLRAIGSIASDIREALGDANPESGKIAADETFTAASLEAARDFSIGQDLASAGKNDEAIAYYKQAIEKDPKFGRAYASWATSAAILGRREESAEAYRRALSLVDRMTEREKYRTLGTYYLTTARNYEKAVENYTELVRLYPADRTGHHNLALAYFYLLDFRRALEEGRRALEIYPKNETSRNNYALYAMYAGDFDTSAREARLVIEQNPNVAKSYLALAMAALARGESAVARDAYARMAKTGAFGASLGNMGAADLALYEGRFADAAAFLEAGIAADEGAKNTAGLAAKLLALAETYIETGRTRAAVESARRALKLGQDETVIVPAARILLRAGDDREARALAGTLGQQLQPQRRAYSRILEGEIALKERRTADAVNAFREAQKLADVWLGRFDLGVAYIQADHYAEALAELELAYKRRGEATAIFLDDVPSFRRMVPLYYWLARAQEALGVSTAASNYKTFLALRPPATKDPLAIDAERRLTQPKY